MRVSEVAQMMGLQPKEVIAEVESLREDLASQGFKLAKRLTASSGLEDDAVRMIMAAVDVRRREVQKKKDEEDAAHKRAEEEARRKEEAERRAREEEARKKAEEEARKKADEALERRRREMARISAPAAPAAPPVVAPPPLPNIPRPVVAPVAAPPVVVAQPTASAPAAPPPPVPAIPAPVASPGPRGEHMLPTRSEATSSPAAETPRSAPPRSNDRPRGGDKRRQDTGKPSKESIDAFATTGIGTEVKKDDAGARRRNDRDRGKRGTGETGTAEDGPRKRRTKGATDPAGRHAFRPTQIFDADAVVPGAPRRRPAPRSGGQRKGGRSGGNEKLVAEDRPKVVRLRGDFTVGQYAEKLAIEPSEIVKKLFLMGQLLTINQILPPDTAELIAIELGIEIVIERESDESDVEHLLDVESPAENLRPRPPVVTVMGHVDHGKTTLLDTIRNEKVADSEHGGITQHIGAYFVHTEKGDIVFLDTPGHAAFTAMRARGANVTDLVVLVVAANDGVKPQTVEAINHAKAADVPIVVAINKIDVEGASATKVKNELMAHGLLDESLGGDTLMVEISAKKGTRVKELLETIALQAEVLELNADPDRPAVGMIVESRVDPNRGAVATVLVTQGTLHPGDVFVCGTEWGRVRAMRDDRGEPLESAGPSTPVEILGLSGAPAAGEQFVALADETEARGIAEKRTARRKLRAAKASPHVTLENLGDRMKEGEVQNLNLIVKADVQGSVEAIVAALGKIKSDKVILQFLHTGVGGVSSADVQLADASDAIIVGFNVRPDPVTRDLAQELGVEIRLYTIIYELLEEIEAAMLGMLEPVYAEVPMATIEVREIFRVSKVGNVCGCFVAEGTVGRDHKARLVRGGSVVWQGKIASLRRHKDEAKEVAAGLECGIALENYNDAKAGDVIETYVLKELEATLVSADSGSGE